MQLAAERLGQLGIGLAEVRGKEAVLQGERLGGLRNGHGRVQLLERGRQPSFWTRRWWRSPANSVVRKVCRQSLATCSPVMRAPSARRSEEHTSELQSLMRISYAVLCLTNKN